MKKLNELTRRKFLGQVSCAAIGYSTLYSSLINLKAFSAAALSNSTVAVGNDYKALVCLFQGGGNDSFNMLMPRTQAEYNAYAQTRSNLAIPREDILAINAANQVGREFGVHPTMSGVQGLFNDNKMAFVSNVGTLLRPTDQNNYDDYSNLPLGLYSHSDQTQQWQTGISNARSGKGWGGKVADLIKDMNTSQDISMNVSLAGTNVFQSGETTVEYAIDSESGSIGIYGHGPTEQWDVFNRVRTTAIDSMIDHQYQDVFRQTYVDVIRRSRDSHVKFQAALEDVPEFQTQFSDNELSQSFKMTARTMAAREALGMRRQIFFMDYHGWDHHDELIDNQEEMFPVLANALAEFQAVMEELGLAECVTTFSISEFGRTLTSNGNGTDHAWGGNVMVMGGSVKGGNIFGEYPDLSMNAPRIVSDGVVIPDLSADQYFAELALWFGVSPTDLDIIFPNLHEFYDTSSSELPIGFLNI
jgi:uncharacterized protein (DUF1501 family)